MCNVLIYNLINKKEKKERFNEMKLRRRVIDWKMCRIVQGECYI